jgi:hypothetical protein
MSRTRQEVRELVSVFERIHKALQAISFRLMRKNW